MQTRLDLVNKIYRNDTQVTVFLLVPLYGYFMHYQLVLLGMRQETQRSWNPFTTINSFMETDQPTNQTKKIGDTYEYI